ncbi:FemAB family protein [Calothrix sp. HK-06]|nr:FemAB family protein [Calothrix sp. HK-06]
MQVEIIDIFSHRWLQMLQKIRHDVYHLPQYILTEAIRTNSKPEAILIIENEKTFCLPYLLRNYTDLFEKNIIDTDYYDIGSPIGYAGCLLNDAAKKEPFFFKAAIEQLIKNFRDRNICSAFFRLHPILNKNINEVLSPEIIQVNGETLSINLNLSSTEIWRNTRSEHRTSINRCKRNGFTAKIVNYKQYIQEFINIYYETMERVGAKTYYYFDSEYFHGLMKLNEVVHLCIVEKDNKITCAGIFTECCGIIQYHLGATKNEFLKEAPSKLMFDYVRYWAKERENQVFHLGGGLGGAKTTSLYHFKAGFSNQKHSFLTLRLILDQEKYDRFVYLRAKTLSMEPQKLLDSNFFPAYRYEV